MPIHDWAQVEPNLFHDFHQTWSIAIRNALNGGLLPKGFSALVEQHAAGVVPDVFAVERRRPAKPPEAFGGGVMTAEPATRVVMRTQARSRAKALAGRGNRVVIRHALGRVVCVIEIVSPGNKRSRSALAGFVRKSVDFLNAGVNLLMVDLFPPSTRDPQGIHKAVWDKIESGAEPFALPSDKRLTLVSYVADEPLRAYVEPVGVGDRLPHMPAYLDGDSYVPVPLEATYESTWASCPADMRDEVEQTSR